MIFRQIELVFLPLIHRSIYPVSPSWEDSPAEGNHPSMKIASSRALSSWNCRSISAPRSWKSGISSSADAQYPETIAMTTILSDCRIRSYTCVFTYSLRNYARVPLEIARMRGTWQRVICFVTRMRLLARSRVRHTRVRRDPPKK